MYRQTATRALFTAGEGGYTAFRIPAVITLPGGRVLAFAEGRKTSLADYGEIDIVYKISTDGGKTFGGMRTAVAGKGNTAGNPAPVYDEEMGKIIMVFNRNNSDGPEHLIMQGLAPRTVHITVSSDGGESWSEERDITPETKLPDWTWYAAGPCHAVKLKSGRLIVPCNHAVLEPDRAVTAGYISHVIYSDDHGETWRIGGESERFTNECSLVQREDGAILLNMRSFKREGCRALTVSRDEGESFTEFRMEPALPEPCCQGAMLSVSRPDGEHILFTNPACSDDRRRMTIHESTDGGLTWSEEYILTEGFAAYSDLTEPEKGKIGVLYEKGSESPYEKIEWTILETE